MGTRSQGASGSDRRVDTWRTARAVLLIAIVATLVSLAPPKNATAASAGLVAAFGFDAGSGTSVADQSGNGNNGTVANTTWATAGKYGKALQFNGTSSLVTVPDAASLHLTSGMTLEAWVDPSTVNGSWRDVVYKGNDNFYLEGTSSNASKPDGGLIAGGSYGDAYGTALPANTWSYLTETYDGATLRLYVNGSQVASTAHTGAISTSTNPLQIGGDSLYGQYFAGLIDEVRVYNTALTATQIQTDQATPISPAGPTFSVGGSLSGLAGTVVLQDNGGDNLSVAASGPFTFATQLASGAAYAVSVKTNPAGQTCTVSNGSGTVGSANVTNVAVSCVTAPTFSVGGSVSGLAGSVVLQDNGGDNLSVAANGPFTFATQLAGGAAYAVSVKTNPSGQTCSVSNGSGTIGSANVTNVAVSCAATTGPSGLVAAFGFDAGSGTSVADQSGNGNNGTVANTTWATAGKYGKALQFNGTSSLVTVPDAASLHLTSGMTLEAWVDPSTVNGSWRDVVYKGNDNFYLEGTSSNASKPDGGLIAGGSYGDAYGTALPANTWSYLTETYDGATLRLYVNGSQVASTAHTGAISTSTNPLQIGGDSLYGQYFAGLIDEVRVYNTALTATQIQTDQTTPISPAGPTFSVGGSLSGLSGTVVLQDNGGDNLSVSGNGPFTFATQLASGAAYSVTVKTNPAGQTCTVSNGSGTVGSANVTNVAVSCVTAPTFSVGGSVSGLAGSVVLQDNGGDNLSVAANGPFTFATQLAGGAAYAVSVKTNPSGQTCSVSNGSGTIGSANVTNVAVSCAATTGPSGLVAAFGFDAGSGTSVADQSGNGNNGTVANTTWATAGKYGKALQFNGTSSLVTVPDAASLHLTSGMTLEAWVDPSTVNGSWRDVVYKGNDNFYLEGTSSNASKPDGGLIAGGSYGDAYGTALPANTWSYLTETYDGATLRLYVNGSQVASTAHTGAISTSTNPLQIGGDSLYGQYFAGLIDEVRVYNTALTATQIQADQATPISSSSLSAPGTLSANAVSPTEIDLSWGAATGGVTGYLIERCGGANCTTFAQIGTSSTTTFNDTTVAANNTYSYRVRATDAANDLGPYSNIATTTTALSVSPNNAVLTFTRTQQYAAQGPGSGSVTWLVDGVAGGNSSSGTITSSGLYTPPSTVGSHTISAATGTATASVTAYVSNYAGTFTFHNDNARDGQNLNETVLTPANVNSTTFGKLFGYPLDGLTFASPLYVPNVSIPGQGFHNIVIVATEHDSVYAFDADGRSSTPLWKDSFINPAAGVTPVPAVDTGETGDIPNEIGITSTPVVDPTTGTMYVDAATKVVSGGTTTYRHALHAIDIATGAEKFGGPVTIQASVPGSGMGSQGGTLSFLPLRENQRTALLLSNGVVYLGFSSRGDQEPFHGWVLGYNATTLQQVLEYCTTANGDDGGVWMSGDGVAADPAGSLYFITGDGLFDASSGGSDYGDSFVKLSSAGTVLDYFSPKVQGTLNSGNLDLGSGGALLLPDQPGSHPHEMVSAGKNGTIYLVDRDNMGKFNANSDQIVQSIPNIWTNVTGGESGLFGAPAYFNGNVYFSPLADKVQSFQLTNGLLTTKPTSQSPETYDGTTSTFDSRGGTLGISANGGTNGIVWALQSNGDSLPGTLHAYDATNLAHELYNSDQAGTRDQLDPWLKFSVPTVANGRVYVASAGQLTAYGLLP